MLSLLGWRSRRPRPSLVRGALTTWVVTTALIGAGGWAVAAALWPHVYDAWGLPFGIGEERIFLPVLFGVGVGSALGGVACALLRTFEPRR